MTKDIFIENLPGFVPGDHSSPPAGGGNDEEPQSGAQGGTQGGAQGGTLWGTPNDPQINPPSSPPNDPPPPGDPSAPLNLGRNIELLPPAHEGSAAEEKDYALDATSNQADKGQRKRKLTRKIARRIALRALAAACAGVFMLSMYTEISSYISAVKPDSIADGIAILAFGGKYASKEAPPRPNNSVDRPHNDNEYVHLDDGSSNSGGGNGGGHADTSTDTTADSGNEPSETTPPEDGERFPIVVRDLSTNAERGLTCSNQTDYELDLDQFADSAFTLPPLADILARYPADKDAPVVLIVHTHGTECYAEEGSDSYSKKDNSRSTDTSKNVVAVGEVIAEYFKSRGIPTIHCTEMFDRESYTEAYEKSSAAVREYLAIYPSIQYIFDVHRDSIISSDLTKYRPATEIDGVSTAQVMCVVGTDAGGSNHKNWRDNLTFAAHLQVRLWNRCQTLPRRLSIRSASFYQKYTPGSLLLEIGSCGNTLSEAKAAALIVAEELSEIIINGE